MEERRDDVNHPKHYTQYEGLEVIDLTEQMNFNRGNVVKYVARAGIKEDTDELVDLKKAEWYIQREIRRIESRRAPEGSMNERLEELRERLSTNILPDHPVLSEYQKRNTLD